MVIDDLGHGTFRTAGMPPDERLVRYSQQAIVAVLGWRDCFVHRCELIGCGGHSIPVHDDPRFVIGVRHKTAQSFCPRILNSPVITLCSLGIPATWGILHPRAAISFAIAVGTSENSSILARRPTTLFAAEADIANRMQAARRHERTGSIRLFYGQSHSLIPRYLCSSSLPSTGQHGKGLEDGHTAGRRSFRYAHLN